MKVTGIDGKEYSWSLSSSELDDSSRSNLHIKARKIIQDVFPFDRFYEDVSLPGSSQKGKNSILFGDFYIPVRSIMIEVNGAQHDKYTSFFHKNKLEFARAKTRDKIKKQWCDLNNITLICFEHNETEEQWKDKLK